jgi:carboxypeptidase C (cathepsin A)
MPILRSHKILAAVFLLCIAVFAAAQQPTPTETPKPAMTPPGVAEEPPVVTRHELRAGGKVLNYKVTTGLMPIKNAGGDTEARMFYMAYTLEREGSAAQRPLMFSFNGGPGSSSVWLHLGALGPKRVRMQDDGAMPPPPFQLADNEHTWLDKTDLVFIDPIGTGYSRAARPELASKFFGLQGDLDSVGEFIRMYLTRHERWPSPLFLVGESYGTTRAAGLAGLLVDKGIAFNGVLLVSAVLNFQTLLFGQGNDLPYLLIYPSYTATAWYHKKLPADLQAKPLRAVLDEAEKWMNTDLAVAFAKGDGLTPPERAAVVDKLARYTGLSKEFISNHNLRVELGRFNKELLRDERRTTGRLDSRFKGIDSTAGADRPEFDPSMSAIRAPYTSVFNSYVRTQLGYKTDAEYYILGGGITAPWNFGVNNGFADTSNALRNAFAKNPFMKVFVAFGYYDMATPFAAAEYTLNHSNLDATHRAHITRAYYEAGHMMYIDTKSLAKLKQDVDKFIDGAWSGK